jgi:hypothetical protein
MVMPSSMWWNLETRIITPALTNAFALHQRDVFGGAGPRPWSSLEVRFVSV